VKNLDKVVEISMLDGSKTPRKFTTLRQEYLDLRTNKGLEVFHTVIPRVKTPLCGPSIDCLYLAGNPMAKDLSTNIAVCPLAWWWHVFKVQKYTERMARSLMDCFKMECADIAHMLTFDKNMGTITTQFPNTDDFLDCIEQEVGSDDDYTLDKSPGGTSCLKSTFNTSEDAKASLASALDDPDMNLATNLHASAKSRRTNFSCSTGNSTNCSVNTKQFALTHKSRALALAQEVIRLL
jgi:hypothetical protein